MRKYWKVFLFSMLIYFSASLLFYSACVADQVFIKATPSSGLDKSGTGLEVTLTCTVAASSKQPISYNFNFGDGSPEETIASDKYQLSVTHFYKSGLYDATCEVVKDSGSKETSEPARVAVAKWRFETGGDVDSSPAIGPDGTLYVGSDDGNLYAINPETGQEIWRFKTGGAIQSTPAVDSDGTVYFGSLDKNFYAVKQNGEVKWSFQVDDEIFSSPAVWSEARIIYFGANDNSIYAINASGTFRWKYQTGDKVISSPSIGHDGTEAVVYVGSMDRHVYALAARTGERKWAFKTNAGVYASPAIGSDGRLYIGELMLESVEEYNYKFYCLNVDGTARWSYTDGTGFYSSAAIGSDGTAYVGSWDGRFFALNSRGEREWMARPGPPYSDLNSSPALGTLSRIFVGSRKGAFYAFKENDDEIALDWSFDAGDEIMYSSPVIDTNGVIYFGSRDNNIYAIEAGIWASDSPWPMFRGGASRTGMAKEIQISDIISTYPSADSRGVHRGLAEIKIYFSPAIDPDQIDLSKFKLEKVIDEEADVREPVEVVTSPDFKDGRPVAILKRLYDNEELPYGTTYTASISYSVPGEQTTAENIEKTYSFSFTTETKPSDDPDPDPSADFGCFIRAMW